MAAMNNRNSAKGNGFQSARSPRLLQVLVVDDSAIVRETMAHILSQDQDISVRVAADPIIAGNKIKLLRPDVIILDLEMPQMDGLTFLRKIMAEAPIPVVICSGCCSVRAPYW